MFRKLTKMSLLVFSLSFVLASCSGGSGGGGSSSGGSSNGGSSGPTLSNHTSPYITADQFVNSINYVDGTNNTYVVLYSDETIRSTYAGEDDYFVIWDSLDQEYKAVSLQYIRQIQYLDYISNNDTLANQFRIIEEDDIAAGYHYGDPNGYDYEDLDLIGDINSNDFYFIGVMSGEEYEDGEETTDVDLVAAELELKKHYTHASAVSVEYNVGIKTALKLVALGNKVGKMTAKGSLNLTDLNVLSSDIEKLTGTSMDNILKAGSDKEVRAKLLKDVADKVGSTEADIEQKLLPELFGIEL